MRLWLLRTLKRRGYSVVGSSGTARESLLHFPRGDAGPDVLLIGYCPDCDYGFDTTLGLFRLLHPHTRIVLLASAPFMLRANFPTLRKPFSATQLEWVLERSAAGVP